MGERERYAAGTAIFREGEPGECAYIIESGAVEIAALKTGRSLVLARLGPRDLFGEMALIDDEVRTASATAVVDTDVLVIPRDYFRRRFSASDPVINLFLRVVLERFRETHEARIRGEPSRPSGPPDRDGLGPDGERVAREISMRAELEAGLARGELELHYQPIVRLDDGTIVGFEALMRWNHPRRGSVPPGEFIGFAERTGVIVPMGLWAMREAVGAVERMAQRLGHATPPWYVSVNVSGTQLYETSELEALIDTVKGAAPRPEQLVLEITESVMVEDPIRAAAALERVRALGVGIAIDDFGTGYSSLGYLQRFPIDTIKIDRTFVAALREGAGSSAKIVRAIASLAHDFGLELVAEGVETEAQRKWLTDLGCRYAQGYLFAPPKPAAALEPLLR
jgi:EAL domain-containing protein (putative c-di-GMP-specific phosphodiesterase class I)